ncbi:MAG: hydroxymethylbilane synthase, partial [Bacilli bacterium]
MNVLRVGTRKSLLARTQTKQTMDTLLSKLPNTEIQYVEFTTEGDRRVDVSLSKVGGKGLFVTEIEEALAAGTIDVAVHSLKDMPARLPSHLTIGCIPKREDRRDVLVLRSDLSPDQLDNVKIIGTSSLRRSLQIQHYLQKAEV